MIAIIVYSILNNLIELLQRLAASREHVAPAFSSVLQLFK